MRLHTLLRTFAFAARFERPVRAAARVVLEPRKPRHRVLRALLGVVGLALLVVLLAVGLVVGAVMITGGLVWRLLRSPQPARPAARGRVVDAAYRVVGRPALSR